MQFDLEIALEGANLQGIANLPESALALVIFVHGSGSSRFSPRNVLVSDILVHAGLGTVLFDLLTEREAAVDRHTREFRFNIDLLARRLAEATEWIAAQPQFGALNFGYFGASTGSAAALIAASAVPDRVMAVVSRGGRPDLAGQALPIVSAPTLLIVGGDDEVVIGLNREALAHLTCEKELRIVPGASHLFEEPGTLELAGVLASEWFTAHLAPDRRPAATASEPLHAF